jgi:hypothetical protein
LLNGRITVIRSQLGLCSAHISRCLALAWRRWAASRRIQEISPSILLNVIGLRPNDTLKNFNSVPEISVFVLELVVFTFALVFVLLDTLYVFAKHLVIGV